MIRIRDFLNCFLCPWGYTLFPCLKKCVCVCWCAAVVFGDHDDRTSCELPPTQSYLSHKNTHIKAKIEAKRLKANFSFPH